MISAPLKPQVKHIETRRLPERKLVTIALGFACHGCVILCSDTQMTSDAGFKFEESKFLCAFEGNVWGAYGVYAGSPQLAQAMEDAMHEMFEKKYGFDKAPSRKEFERDTQAVATKVCSKSHAEIQVLWAFSSTEMVHLYKVDRKTVTRVHERDCLGVGDSSLARYLVDHLAWVSPVDAARSAAYIVKQAIKYIDGVGGKVEMWKIYRRGHWRHLEPEKQGFARVHRWLPKGSFPKQTIVRSWDKELKRVRKLMKKKKAKR